MPSPFTAEFEGSPGEVRKRDIRKELKIPSAVPSYRFVGRIDPNKRPHLFLRAANGHSILPEVHFVLAGVLRRTSEYRHDLKQSFMHPDRIHFSHTRLPLDVAVCGRFSVFAFTSRHEGFPRAVIEAMFREYGSRDALRAIEDTWRMDATAISSCRYLKSRSRPPCRPHTARTPEWRAAGLHRNASKTASPSAWKRYCRYGLSIPSYWARRWGACI